MAEAPTAAQTVNKNSSEELVKQAEADALFLSIGNGAIATDEKGKIRRVNQIALETLGYKENELVGKWYPTAIKAQNDEGHPITGIDRPIVKSILSGKPESSKMFYGKRDGSFFPVALTVSPILVGDKPIGSIEVFRDYSAEYEVDKMKSEFISLASHQLRTPLTSIMLNAHMLADGYAGELDKEKKQLVDAVVNSTDRMTELVTMLLNITRIEAGRMTINPVPCDFEKQINQIIEELKPKATEKGVELSFVVKAKLAPINTDEAMFNEIIANYVSNAIKYTPAKGKVEVVLEKSGQDALLSVSDNGYGIPKAEQARVFSKFFRATNIMKQEAVGTGLGLYLVKIVAESLGGSVGFKSTVGKGTTFWFRIPLSGSEARSGTTAMEKTNVIV